MARGYWVMTFRSTADQAGVDRYAAIAGPAIRAHGGRILAAGVPAAVFESGLSQRVAIVEFESIDSASKAYASADYQKAVRELAGAAERDVRLIEGL